MSSDNRDIYIRNVKVGDIAAIVMIAAAIVNLLMYFLIPYVGEDLLTPHIGNVALIITGGYILFNRKLTTMRAVPYVSIGIGTYEILANLYPNELAMNGLLIIEVLYVTLGLVLIYMGLANWFRYRYNVTRMALISIILLILCFIPLYIEYWYYTPFTQIFMDNLDMLPSEIMYAFFIFLVTRKGIWYPSVRTRMSNNLDVLTASLFCDGREYITPSDMQKLMYKDTDGWETVDVGPVERTIRITLNHPDLNREIIIEKWKGSSDIRLVIVPTGYAQLTEGFRFVSNVQVIAPEGNMITFYDHDG